MQNAIIDPLVMAPANAQTSTAAIGCVDPSTAPKRPAIMANAKNQIVIVQIIPN